MTTRYDVSYMVHAYPKEPMLKAIFNGFKGKIRGKLDILELGTTHKV